MNLFLWNIFLAFVYGAISDNFSTPTLVFGFVLGYFVLWISHPKRKSIKYFGLLRHLVIFFFFYLWEFILASLRIAWDVVTPGHKRMRPGIVAVPLDAKTDGEINLLANLITLTPGGISLDVSSDRKVLYVYEIYLDEKGEKIDKIKSELERRVLELMR